MSEKNLSNTQWINTKTNKPNYDSVFVGAIAATPDVIVGTDYNVSGPAELMAAPSMGSLQQHYTNVRPTTAIGHHVPPPLQLLPQLHSASVAKTTTSNTTLLLPMGPQSSNVPVASSFVPPSYNVSAASTVTSSVTSVLTPNPFAVHGSGAVAFGLDQQMQQQLNSQQQFEFTKIMTAMNTAAATTFTLAGATQATPSANAAATSASNILAQQQTDGRHHHGMELSAMSSGAITTTIAENVLKIISMTSNTSTQVRSGVGVKLPDEEKMRRIQSVVESGISDHSKQQILQILEQISTLKPMEKLLLYLRLPGEAPETDPLRHPQNPLGTRSEINHTINWVRSHLEHDPQVSIPKQDVYNEYIAFCDRLSIKPLSTADFGKVMKQVFPEIRPRRLGTRGHSRYCYAAMRKTTKLAPPTLPQLGPNLATKSTECDELAMNTSFGGNGMTNVCSDSAWQSIKMWAESTLNIKVENMKSLAEHIEANNLIGSGSAQGTLLHQKKTLQRDPKEKRTAGDLGPLKKRRKKKRKGSSSSESSCNLTQHNYVASSNNMIMDEKKSMQLVEVKQEILDSPNYQRISNMTTPNLPISSMSAATITRDGHLSREHIFKQEKAGTPLPPHRSVSLRHSGGQQLLPINLATDAGRTVLTRAPPPAIVGLANPTNSSTAVQNLTPKIMDLSAPATATIASAATATLCATSVIEQVPIKEEVTASAEDYNLTNVFCKKVLKAQQTKGFWANSPITVAGSAVTVVATSSPMSVIATANNVADISSSAAAASSTAVSDIDIVPQTSHYLMGPPAAQFNSNNSTVVVVATSSPSTTVVPSPSSSSSSLPLPSSSLEIAVSAAITQQPKVASRNMLQLRAKKLRYYQMRESLAAVNNAASPINETAASSTVGSGDNTGGELDKDAADLPENLGLPRERVISICNMDKHELDDYFLTGEDEEESSQDQEAELLQYFQTGDAEEKLNSFDAAKLNNPTALHCGAIAATKNSCGRYISQRSSSSAAAAAAATQATTTHNVPTMSAYKKTAAAAPEAIIAVAHESVRTTFAKGRLGQQQQQQEHSRSKCYISAKTTTKHAPTVGSASASLALMSQKHQQQQQHEQQPHEQHHQQQKQQKKRKINLNMTTINGNNGNNSTTRKNCIFLPISPNINYTAPKVLSTSTAAAAAAAAIVTQQQVTAPANGSCCDGTAVLFASPGMKCIRAKPAALCKQQSLDCNASNSSSIGGDSNSSDPMIGASRRRRKSIYRTSSAQCSSYTSASAPPSPSPMQQQRRHQMFRVRQQQQRKHQQQHSMNNHHWLDVCDTYNDITNQTAALLINEQNSLDFDLFDAAAAADRDSLEQSALLDAAADCNSRTSNSSIGSSSSGISNVLAPLLFAETQRSQSVPLSQLQRRHSPAFSRRCFQQPTTNFSTCTSVALQTPVPIELADYSIFSENSSKAATAAHNDDDNDDGRMRHRGSVKLENPAVVLASDAAAILDEVTDVSDTMASGDFVDKLGHIFHSASPLSRATTTTRTMVTCSCSSAGSSSGYSSNGTPCNINSDGGCVATSVGGSIVSRSVPSTPLPHQQQYHQLVGCGNQLYERQCAIDENVLQTDVLSTNGGAFIGIALRGRVKHSGRCGKGGGEGKFASRATYDISKSMPTTPITTPCFRYSPVDFHRDFLLNGNTIDDITSLPTINALDDDSFMNGGDIDGTPLSSKSLMNDGGGGNDSPHDFTSAAAAAESIIVDSDILTNL